MDIVVRKIPASAAGALSAALLIPACILALVGPMIAADSTAVSKRDTAEYAFPEVQVNAHRTTRSAEATHSALTTLTRRDIARVGARQVSDVLQFVPGAFIRDYGGLGGLKSIALRGAAASQTLVLLDGIRLNSVQNGMIDLSVLPIELIEKIEVARGGGSALYGAHALGGVVNIQTLRSQRNFGLSGNIDVGSFNERSAALTADLPLGHIQTLVSGEIVEADGDFPFVFNQFGSDSTLRRENGDFINRSLTAHVTTDVSGARVSAHANIRTTRRGAPGAVVQGSVELARARLDEDEIRVHAASQFTLSKKELLDVSLWSRRNKTRYRDPDATITGPSGIDEAFTAHDAGFASHYYRQFDATMIAIRGAASYSDLLGTTLQPEAGNWVRRINTNIAVQSKTDLRFLQAPEIALLGGLRIDHYSDFGVVLSPLISASWECDECPYFARTLWSYDFRPPSFNELYYLNFGNADLDPERSNALSTGFGIRLARDALRITLDGFYRRTLRQIVAVPRSPVSWSARNIGLVVTKGIEASVGGATFDGDFSTNVAFTLQRATDESDHSITSGAPIVYTPNHIISGSISWNPGSWNLAANVYSVGRRYALPNGAQESALEPFTTVQMSVGFEQQVFGASSFLVKVISANIFDSQYAIIRHFPAPGRSIRLSLQMRYRNAAGSK